MEHRGPQPGCLLLGGVRSLLFGDPPENASIRRYDFGIFVYFVLIRQSTNVLIPPAMSPRSLLLVISGSTCPGYSPARNLSGTTQYEPGNVLNCQAERHRQIR